MYFSKITQQYMPNNRLRKAALVLVQSLEYQLVESPDQLKAFVADRIQRMNRSNPRCKPLTVSLRPSYQKGNYLLDVDDLITVSLYGIKGTFVDDSASLSSQPQASHPGNYNAEGTQLGLFLLTD